MQQTKRQEALGVLDAAQRALHRLRRERELLEGRISEAQREVLEASRRYHEVIGDLPTARKEED